MSRVLTLPFINLDPSDTRTIYTSLMMALTESKLRKQSCVITFDQPLYWKAVDMVAAADDSDELSRVIVRLGGFHLLMSFMGSIGSVMAGSGLEEIWERVYSKNTVAHMMTGHAYARALRAHSLTQLAPATTLLKDVMPDIGETKLDEVRAAYDNILQDHGMFNNTTADACITQCMSIVISNVNDIMTAAAALSRTAKLWKQYFEQLQLLRLFIRAERCGDWELHLHCVQQMLPHFHAAGHLPYAKAAHLYLQQMLHLRERMNAEDYARFTDGGYFTVRRTNNLWAGLWTDLTIEQVLMRSMKTRGGLTHGRGLTDSVVSRWIIAMPACAAVCDNLDFYCRLKSETTDQHVELRDSRQARDVRDFNKFSQWLEKKEPFSSECKHLVSLSSGVVGNETTNCDSAVENGVRAMQETVDNTFGRIHLKRSNKVKSLATVSTGLTVREEVIAVNTTQLFNRIICTCKSEADLRSCLKYELATRPPSLFDEISMRKGCKAKLCEVFEKKVKCAEIIPQENISFVIDGGYLLHRVLWNRGPITYGTIYNLYVRYVVRHYGIKSTVVFDGYSNQLDTKSEEHRRRASKAKCPDIEVDDSLAVTVTQTQFLINPANKSKLISALSKHLLEAGITVVQAPADADVLIVNTGVKLSETGGNTTTIVIVGEDTDLIVIMIALSHPDSDMLLLKPRNAHKPDRVYSSKDLQRALGSLSQHILFVHAVSGCDTTSAPYRKGKQKHFNLLNSKPELCSIIDVFNSEYATQDDIAAAGEKYLLELYGAPENVATLDEHRFWTYNRMTAKQLVSNNFALAALPPTTDAATQHSLRVYHQVQQWRGNDKTLTDWGWKMLGEIEARPVTITKPPAPDSLLELVSCNCKTGCHKLCSCRKASLLCTPMCGHCRGISCENKETATNIIFGESDDVLDDIDTIWNSDGIT